MSKTRFVYFGGEPLGVPVLEELEADGQLPSMVICNPDRPVGRKQELTPPRVKIWAEERNIEVFQPTTYKDDEAKEKLLAEEWDVFVVVAYNFILPQWLLDIPKHGVLNVHPSLLPKLRGASPIRTAILEDLREDIGVTVMQMDAEMDHGPILDQIIMPISDENWPIPGPELDTALARAGGALLSATLPEWVASNLSPQEQDHELATYCGKLTKSDSELQIDPKNLPTGEEAWNNWLKINAFEGIGGTFFMHDEKRIKVAKAEFSDNTLNLLRVTPEGKKEINFSDYLHNLSD